MGVNVDREEQSQAGGKGVNQWGSGGNGRVGRPWSVGILKAEQGGGTARLDSSKEDHDQPGKQGEIGLPRQCDNLLVSMATSRRFKTRNHGNRKMWVKD